ncbi:MAG: hypothetical protein U0441_05395 [Polyangiaceae bacterium]
MVRALWVGLLIMAIWMGADYVMHFSALAPYYSVNPGLWRPAAEMNIGLVFVVRIALIAAFMAAYHWYVTPKSVRSGALFGVLIGAQLGVGVGLGTYIHIPIPAGLAVGWLLGAIFKSVAAGLVVGWLLRPSSRPVADKQ